VGSLALEFTLGVCLLACLPGVGGFASANIYLPIRQYDAHAGQSLSPSFSSLTRNRGVEMLFDLSFL